ncbi:3-hydroxyacyl-CoA dehydrogenase [Salinarimonas sp.]|uniref:3-hydroxyacyl-CoA dehydrogenase n=1 Tax=Salinarimonas sp. TaxID=2766526 RepID=UPI003918DBB6
MERQVAIVGAGLIGRAWSVSFARGGCAVRLYDPVAGVAEAAHAALPAMLAELAAHDLLGGQSPAEVHARTRVCDSLAAALDGAEHVQESAPERLPEKRALFSELDARAAPDAVLCSSTSSLLPSAFSDHLAGRARVLVGHPINPPCLVPAVEIVPAPWTDPQVVERTADLMIAIGQKPIRMTREIDGFIMNRLQGALLQEAFRLVAAGIASAEDVDIGIRDGLGLRWAFMGPFETIDLNAPGGIADYIARYEGMFRLMAQGQTAQVDWGGPLSETLEAERAAILPREGIAARQAWRDRRLMALAAHRRADRDEDETEARTGGA